MATYLGAALVPDLQICGHMALLIDKEGRAKATMNARRGERMGFGGEEVDEEEKEEERERERELSRNSVGAGLQETVAKMPWTEKERVESRTRISYLCVISLPSRIGKRC